MPLEDVSHDPSLINWLRQSGHGHLLENNRQQYPTSPIRSRSEVHYRDYSPEPHTQIRSPSLTRVEHLQRPSSFDYQPNPTQFVAPNAYNPDCDPEIERLRHDPKTQVIHRPNHEDVLYKQRVFVKYLQPPTPPPGGTIIIREKQPPPPPPDPPLVIRRAPPPPPTPPPLVIRERPPPILPPEGTMVINKFVPPGPKPPRQVIIEQHPQLPPKPRDVIIERWLPARPRQRRVIYERLPPAPPNVVSRPVIVQHSQPRIHVQRQVINTVPAQISQTACSTLPTPSSLIACDPLTSLHTASNPISCQPNVVIVQTPQHRSVGASNYTLPMSYASQPQLITGLDTYSSGVGQSHGSSSTVYNFPDTVPVDQILNQLGVNASTLQQPAGPQVHTMFPSSHSSSFMTNQYPSQAQVKSYGM